MNKPVVALIYDFDNTLSTKDMQEFTFIPALGMEPAEFWNKTDELAHSTDMDHILAYMYLMAKEAKSKHIPLDRDALKAMGKDVQFFPGVEDWFCRINAYGESVGLEVRHYILSCGLKSMIEGCKIANQFHNIFACDYIYDDKGEPLWPSIAINYTSKTQFLYRINKGVEDIGEDAKLNMYMSRDERVVPFDQMIYIGDGLTDVPSMKLVRQRNGYAIGVYKKPTDAAYLVDQDRVDFYLKCDYTEGGEIDTAMKAILAQIATKAMVKELSQSSYKAAKNTK
ncbi:MAG: haloacid dehalogenase-like hydrolase [Clostridia bacterium]|nr:haloacid dehalogenase-like hydrolase [Clostridia bacterium]